MGASWIPISEIGKLNWFDLWKDIYVRFGRAFLEYQKSSDLYILRMLGVGSTWREDGTYPY